MTLTRITETEYNILSEVEGQAVSGAARSKVLVTGDQLTMEKVTFENGSSTPDHSHDFDTICYVAKGKVRATVGGETFIAEVGDSFSQPRAIPHSIYALHETTVLLAKPSQR